LKLSNIMDFPNVKRISSIDAGNHWKLWIHFFTQGVLLAQDQDSQRIYAGGSPRSRGVQDRRCQIGRRGGNLESRFYLPTKRLGMNTTSVADDRGFPGNPRIIFVAATEEDQALISVPITGVGWRKNVQQSDGGTYSICVLFRSYTVLCCPRMNIRLLAGTIEGVFISTNGGNVWRKNQREPATQALAYDFIQIASMATDDGVYYSESGTRGSFWIGTSGSKLPLPGNRSGRWNLICRDQWPWNWRYSYSVGWILEFILNGISRVKL
jgi:hypothetical protein